MLLLANLSKHNIRFYSNELERKITKGNNKLTPWMHNIISYYALNKILNSDWSNTNLSLVDVWLAGSNVRQRNFMSGW